MGGDAAVWSQQMLKAIDPKTGKIAWTHVYQGPGGGASGLLTTAGKLLFGGDPSSNLIAFNPEDGKILWHAGVGAAVANAPMTYEIAGRQYLVAAGGDTLFAFALPNK